MDDEDLALLRELKDRHEIYDCLMRYCRGIDRFDREMLLSAYHPGAIDDHGAYVGPVEGFADYVFDFHNTYQQRTQHHITNHRCRIDGDVAHTESYYIFRGLNREPPLYFFASGRYIDRFEKREGIWAIAERVCLVDIRENGYPQESDDLDGNYMRSARDRSDTSYMQPLTVDPARFTG